MERGNHEPLEELELTSRLNALKSQAAKADTESNLFPTPSISATETVPSSAFTSSTALYRSAAPPTYFRSRRIRKGEQERPWLDKKDPKEKWVWIIPLIGLLIGLGLAGVQVWYGLQRVSKHSYCTILDEDWSRGLDEQIWTKEVEVGGFGYVA